MILIFIVKGDCSGDIAQLSYTLRPVSKSLLVVILRDTLIFDYSSGRVHLDTCLFYEGSCGRASPILPDIGGPQRSSTPGDAVCLAVRQAGCKRGQIVKYRYLVSKCKLLNGELRDVGDHLGTLPWIHH